ncbi:serine/threonine protein kinase [Candidatus Uabimicrobium amorphum]|uniref:non-specific serine/threonine protein kinase n=1 Tax=Uabimicrobium amorphum TaxID=2596890 RepID=A0A5S9ITS4_UABAM|nr:serine/threonine-protein kinase [Candidatus Uabimicrobium amorphum]BBM87476.1 protein kinase [Candidatus Uabimicrobium amorphum]
MEFERWLLSEGLSGSLTQEEFNRAKQVYHQQRQQGNEIGVAEVLIKLGYIDNESLNQLKQQYVQKQNNPLEETIMQVHKLTLFEELLKKDQPAEDAIYPTQIIEEKGNLKPDLPPVSFDDTLRHDKNDEPEVASTPDIHTLPNIEESQEEKSENESDMIGRYKVHRKLGEGNMGEVFLVRDDNLQRDVALKLISSGTKSNKNIERFRREARAVAQLDHPNIVGIYDIGDEGGNVFFTMQYIEGQSLEEYLAKNKRMSLRKAVDIMIKLSRALHFAHQKKIIHRDIKPANVMLDKKGEPYIMDFGLARDIEGGTKVTKTQAFAGTPSYMSPEQARNRHKEIDAQSDIYSLGVTFYELLTGRLPFEARELVALLTKIAKAAPPPPTTYVKEIPRTIENICLKAMAKTKEKRYYRAIDMTKDLENYLKKKQENKTHNVNFQREDLGSQYKKYFPAVAAFIVGLIVMYIFAPPTNTEKLQELESKNSDLQDKLRKYQLQDGIKTVNKSIPIGEKHVFIGKKQGFFLTPVVHNNFLVVPLLKKIKGKRNSVFLYAARLTNKPLDFKSEGIFDTSVSDAKYIFIKDLKKTTVVAGRVWKNSVYVVTGRGVYRFYGGVWKLICAKSFGNTSQPVFCGETMFFISHSKRRVMAVDLNSSRLHKWSLALKNSKACYLGAHEETLVVSKIDEDNPQRGKVQVFQVQRKIKETANYTTQSLVNSAPVVRGTKIYTTAGEYFEVYDTNSKEKTVLYTSNHFKQNETPIYFDEYTNIICKKQILGLEINNGSGSLLWEKNIKGTLTSPVGLGNSMYYIANQSYLYLMFRGVAVVTYQLKVPGQTSKMYENWFSTDDTIYYTVTEKKGYKDETSYIYKLLK